MKKITIVILAILYITTSSGVVITVHYCMGKLVDLTFLRNKDQLCSNCSMPETSKKDCCKQEKKILKTEKVQNTTAVKNYHFPQHSFRRLANYFELVTVHVVALKESYLLYFGPPRAHILQRFIRYCDLRI